MAPDLSDAQLHAFLEAGLSQREIVRRTGIPRSTLQRRLNRLGLQVTPPVQRPVSRPDTGAVQSVDTGAVQAISTEVEQLKADVHGLRLIVQAVVDRLDHPPVQTPVQITALPPYPQGKAVRWNLWILDAIKDQISARAAERNLSSSELVQEYLWKALTDQSPSMP